jgi:hypothetical protein
LKLPGLGVHYRLLKKSASGRIVLQPFSISAKLISNNFLCDWLARDFHALYGCINLPDQSLLAFSKIFFPFKGSNFLGLPYKSLVLWKRFM